MLIVEAWEVHGFDTLQPASNVELLGSRCNRFALRMTSGGRALSPIHPSRSTTICPPYASERHVSALHRAADSASAPPMGRNWSHRLPF
jgi:hypothetical protein